MNKQEINDHTLEAWNWLFLALLDLLAIIFAIKAPFIIMRLKGKQHRNSSPHVALIANKMYFTDYKADEGLSTTAVRRI